MSGRRGLLLGLDVGTQSLRAALVDRYGRTVAYGVSPIETTYPNARPRTSARPATRC
jgi:sugar (pentulose or hexulose) kinase